MPLYESILDTIGRTPIVKLQRLAPEHVSIYVKVESFNPGGSVKDRLALAVVLDAEARGLLKPGDTIAECTSGNVGIALAMVAAARGYNFVAIMSDSYSIERRKLIRAYGGKVLLFPAHLGSSGGNQIADELAQKFGWFRSRQFDNPANPSYHRETTATEILGDFAGKRLDYFVTGSAQRHTDRRWPDAASRATCGADRCRRTGKCCVAVGRYLGRAPDSGTRAQLHADHHGQDRHRQSPDRERVRST